MRAACGLAINPPGTAVPGRFHFLPSTRMPTFYGMHEHLSGQTLVDARRFEAVEIQAVAECLLASTETEGDGPVKRISNPPQTGRCEQASCEKPAGVTESPSPERGRRLDAHGEWQEDEDDDGHPAWFFTLWEPAVINGRVWPVGGAEVAVPKHRLTHRRPSLGGTLARLLYPVVLAEARAADASALEAEAWGWVAPALVQEGAKVQPAWLYDYLLQPRVIRPAAVLRMPRFNLSPEEAGNLVEYFAAAGVEFPYGTGLARRSAAVSDEQRLDNAVKILVDRTTFCAKCHLIGDYSPGGLWTSQAPNLGEAGRRLCQVRAAAVPAEYRGARPRPDQPATARRNPWPAGRALRHAR